MPKHFWWTSLQSVWIEESAIFSYTFFHSWKRPTSICLHRSILYILAERRQIVFVLHRSHCEEPCRSRNRTWIILRHRSHCEEPCRSRNRTWIILRILSKFPIGRAVVIQRYMCNNDYFHIAAPPPPLRVLRCGWNSTGMSAPSIPPLPPTSLSVSSLISSGDVTTTLNHFPHSFMPTKFRMSLTQSQDVRSGVYIYMLNSPWRGNRAWLTIVKAIGWSFPSRYHTKYVNIGNVYTTM